MALELEQRPSNLIATPGGQPAGAERLEPRGKHQDSSEDRVCIVSGDMKCDKWDTKVVENLLQATPIYDN